MPKENQAETRVRFEHGVPVQLMAIDGTWRRDCVINDVSEADATLTINTAIEGLQLTEFFLLLSSTGLAYRRCSLSWVNGDQVRITFIRQKGRKKPDLASKGEFV
ncbi:MAG: PilZ domain-containing protein [Bradyrhizobium sp.]